MARYQDLTGTIHGDFVVVEEYSEIDPVKGRLWICQCQKCGAKEIIPGNSIRKHTHKFCSTCICSTDKAMERFAGIAENINEELRRVGERTQYTAETVRDAWLWHQGVIFD